MASSRSLIKVNMVSFLCNKTGNANLFANKQEELDLLLGNVQMMMTLIRSSGFSTE